MAPFSLLLSHDFSQPMREQDFPTNFDFWREISQKEGHMTTTNKMAELLPSEKILAVYNLFFSPRCLPIQKH